jgi:uncharacterized repeat protein (TIGR01451 family)
MAAQHVVNSHRSAFRRSSVVVIAAAAMAAAAAPWAAVRPVAAETLPAECQLAVTTVTCTYTTGDNLFVVPDGATVVHVEAVGAMGARAGATPLTSGFGGHGAVATGDLPVSGGSTLHAVVGGNGAGIDDGFNGGGVGGPAADYLGGGDCPGGAGGGASDVRTASTAASRQVVAGGGGGAGCRLGNRTDAFLTDGGDAGSRGAPCHGVCPGEEDGRYSSDGLGGQAGCIPPDATDPTDQFSCGHGAYGGLVSLPPEFSDLGDLVRAGGGDGSIAMGGAGGIGLIAGGGGGGGGYYGGGAGGGGGSQGNGGGGGGGSSLIPPGGSLSIDTTGVPRIKISYSTIPLSPISFTSGLPPAGDVGQPYSFQYAATGDEAITLSVSSGLPPGLILDATGLLSGTPAASGTYAFTVVAIGSSEVPTSRDDTIVVAAAVAAAAASPVVVEFGPIVVGSTSAAQTVSLTNTGATLVSIGSVTIDEPAAGFAIVADGCSGQLLPPGVPCAVAVTFTPPFEGPSATTLRFHDDAADTPQAVSLSGSGGLPPAPVASVAPQSVDFGSQTTGTTSPTHLVTLGNTGTGPLVIGSATIGGLNGADFATSADTCTGSTLAPGTACTVSVAFSPSAAGSRSATLQFTDNAAGSPQSVPLTGMGVEPVGQQADLAVSIAASPNPVKAGSRVTYTITILNAGPNAALNVLLNDMLSSQSTFVSARPSQGTCVTPVTGSSGTVSCSIGSIASGATSATQIVVTAIAKKTSITNTVTVSSSTSDPNLANNTASITTRVK